MRRYAEKRLREEKEMKELVQLTKNPSKTGKLKLQEIKKGIGVFLFSLDPDHLHIIF